MVTPRHMPFGPLARSFAAVLFACVTAVCGCNMRYDGEPPQTNGVATQQADATLATDTTIEIESTTEPTTDQQPIAEAAKPGDARPQLAIAELAEQVARQMRGREEIVEAEFFPKGFSKLRRVVDEVSGEEMASDDQTLRGVVRVTYTKNFTLLFPTREAAEAADEFFAASPAPDMQAMNSPLNPRQTPILLEITYEAVDGQWQRKGWRTDPIGKESSTLAEDLELP